jgi:hypothetical protein
VSRTDDWATALDEHERVVTAFVALLGQVPADAWHHRTAPGRWSPAELTLHVCRAYAARTALQGPAHERPGAQHHHDQPLRPARQVHRAADAEQRLPRHGPVREVARRVGERVQQVHRRAGHAEAAGHQHVAVAHERRGLGR